MRAIHAAKVGYKICPAMAASLQAEAHGTFLLCATKGARLTASLFVTCVQQHAKEGSRKVRACGPTDVKRLATIFV